MLCGGALFIHMTRGVVTPKSNCISRGDSSTKDGRGIYAFSTFRPIFRCWNRWISGNPPTHVVTICLKFIFPKYQLWTLRNEKVIPDQATVVHDTEILKTRNFRKYWRWWAVLVANMLKFYRWREFQCLMAAHFSFTWLVEWLHRRVIASAGAIARRNPVMESGRLRPSDRFFDVETNGSQEILLPK